MRPRHACHCRHDSKQNRDPEQHCEANGTALCPFHNDTFHCDAQQDAGENSPPTLTLVERNTMRMRSPRCAPSGLCGCRTRWSVVPQCRTPRCTALPPPVKAPGLRMRRTASPSGVLLCPLGLSCDPLLQIAHMAFGLLVGIDRMNLPPNAVDNRQGRHVAPHQDLREPRHKYGIRNIDARPAQAY